MSEAFAKNLERLLHDRGIDQQKNLSNAIGISEPVISRWLAGTREPNPKQRKKLVEFLKISDGELYGFAPNVDKIDRAINKIPVISWVHANQFESITDPFLPGAAEDHIFTTTKGENMFALKVRNDCMEPEFNEGDIIIVNPHVNVGNNDYVVIKDPHSQEATFKQYKIYGKSVVLHPLNPKYPDIELDQKKKYIIVGKVVEKVKKY